MDQAKQDRLKVIFASLCDRELCSCLMGAIESEYSNERLMNWDGAIPEERRAIYYLWGMYGFIQCEGFARFWLDECNHQAFATALKNIGCDFLANIVEESLSALENKTMLGRRDLLEERYSWKELEALADPYEDVLYKESESITSHLGVYIRSRLFTFEDLTERIIKCSEHQLRSRNELYHVDKQHPPIG